MVWLRVSLRLLIALIGVGMIVVTLVTEVVGPLSSVLAYRSANPCAASAAYSQRSRCIGSVGGTVTDVWFTKDNGDSGTEYDYYLKVKTSSGAVMKLTTDKAIYKKANPGDRASLRMWDGIAVGASVDGLTDVEGARALPLMWIVWMGLVWLGLGLVLWPALGDVTDGEYLEDTFARALSWALLGLVTVACFAIPVVVTAFPWWAYTLDATVWLCATVVIGTMIANADTVSAAEGTEPLL